MPNALGFRLFLLPEKNQEGKDGHGDHQDGVNTRPERTVGLRVEHTKERRHQAQDSGNPRQPGSEHRIILPKEKE